MKELFKKAHQLTKEIKKEFPEVDYRFQFSLCLAYLQEGEKEMVKLEGTEKQVKWAEDIKRELIEMVNERYTTLENKDMVRAVARNYKEEIKEFLNVEKLTRDIAIPAYNKMLDIVKANIENETSAKKLIDVKQSLKLADANFKEYVFNVFYK